MNSLPSQTRGGWFSNSSLLSKGTGVALGTVFTLLAHPATANIGTAGSTVYENRQPYDSLNPQLKVSTQETSDRHKTTSEELQLIRSLFRPTMSELASIFGVSRQALYNWLAGEDPVPAHSVRIKELAMAADLFVTEGIKPSGQDLKRKLTDGKSLLESFRDGGAAQFNALALIRLLKRENEQRTMLNQRLAGRLNRNIDPWDLGSPVMNEKA